VQDTIAATPYPVVEFRGGLLSVRVRNSLWEAVLKEIERQTGISMRLVGLPAGTLTHEFEAVPLEKGLRRLFCDANLVFFYANSSGKEPSDGGPNSSRNTFLDSNAAGNDGDDANLQMPSFGNTFVANHFNNPEGLEQACINLPN
jgi:hypothetical protein